MSTRISVLIVVVMALLPTLPFGFNLTGKAGLKAAQTSTQKNALTSGRRTVNFNRDWKFTKGDQPGAETPNFDDSSWQKVRLPHDWAISGPFNPKGDGYAGKLPWQRRRLVSKDIYT